MKKLYMFLGRFSIHNFYSFNNLFIIKIAFILLALSICVNVQGTVTFFIQTFFIRNKVYT